MNTLKNMSGWIISGFIFLCSGCDISGSTSAAQSLERAKAYLDEQKYAEAIIELKNSLLVERDNIEARYLLGKSYLATHDPASAEKELISARRLGLPEAAIQPDLSKALFAQNKYEQVLNQSPPGDMSNELYAEWLSVRGESFLALGRKLEAEKTFKNALEIYSDSPAAITGMARIAAVEGEYKDARDLLSRAHAEYAPAWALLGEIETQNGNLTIAEQAYSKAIKIDPNNWSYLISRGLTLLVQKKFEEASADIEKARVMTGRNPQITYTSGLLHFQQKQYPEAKELFEATLRIKQDDMPTIFYLATTNLILGNYEQAEDGYDRFLTHNPADVTATKLQAITKLRLGDSGETERLSRSVLKNNPQDTLALKAVASALVDQGKADQSIEYLRKVVASNPHSPSAHQQLGSSLIAQGEQQEGMKHLEKALELDSESGSAAASLITAHIQNGNLDLALEKALANVEDNPDKASPHVLLGIVYFQRNELNDAEKSFMKALVIEPASPAAYNGLASIAVKSNDYEKAKRHYTDGLKNNPQHLKLLMNLSEVEARLGNREGSVYALEQAVKYHPDEVKPLIALSRSYLQSGDGGKTIELLSNTSPRISNEPTVMALRAEAHLSMGQFSQALTTLQRLNSANPNDANVHYLLAKAYNGLGERNNTREELTKTIELNPAFVFARIALARVLIEDKELSLAEEQIQSLRGQLGPSNPDLLLLEAQLQELKGDKQGAILNYQKIFLATPTSETLTNLAKAQWRAGNTETAIKNIEDWLEKHPDDTSSELTLVNMYLHQERNDDAIRLLKKINEETPGNVFALSNLALLLHETQPIDAMKYAEQANTLAPESANVMYTMAVTYLSNGNTEKAMQYINRALTKKPGQATFLFQKALILERAGRRDEAIKELTALLKNNQFFPEREDAERTLERLTGS